MKKHFLFEIKKDYDLDQALEELHQHHFFDLYCIEDPFSVTNKIGGWTKDAITPSLALPFIAEMREASSEVDWEVQWTTFAPAEENGLVCIDLSSSKDSAPCRLLLAPGAGFGDFSHPTTRLVLDLMRPFIYEKYVIDLGCGSGILTLASSLLGAAFALGIDIDEAALDHARQNQKLNHLSEKVTFTHTIDPQKISSPPIILMNMIISEQIQAWGSCPFLHSIAQEVIVSGILEEQKASYLQLTKTWGWRLIQEKKEEGWLGFVFIKNKKSMMP